MTRPYLGKLVGTNLEAIYARRGQFALTSLSLFIQSAMFFAVWVIFFGTVSQVHGWRLAEVEIFQGVVNTGLGIALFFCDGAWHLDRKIISGELDPHLSRPRHPLPVLVLGEAYGFTGPGYAAFGLFLLALARLDWQGLGLALLASFLVGGLILGMCILCKTLAFFIVEDGSLPDQMLNMIIVLSITPQQGQTGIMKLLLFTLLPAGFMVIMPVEIVRQHSLRLLAWLAMAASGYLLLAVAAFNAGLHRYTSATGWKV